MCRKTLLVLVALIAGALLQVNSPSASAASEVDQAQEQVWVAEGFAASMSLGPQSHLAQTFTAGRTGYLDKIDLRIGVIDPGTFTFELTAGAPSDDVVLASTSVSSSAFPQWQRGVVTEWATVTFDSPARVQAGDRYAIVATSSTATGGWHAIDGRDLYPGGESYGRHGDGATWSALSIYSAMDLTFRTYVDLPVDDDQDGYDAEYQDCDDTESSVNPGATEVYNGVDDDCDSAVDEDLSAYYPDDDGDGYGRTDSEGLYAAGPPDGWVENSSDCDDTTSSINPSAIEEYNQVDDNCDGNVDEGLSRYYRDRDADGFGRSWGSEDGITYAVSPPEGYVTNNDDCDDSDPLAYPGADETYNGLDDDCDGPSDEGFAPYYPDSDGDDYGAGDATYAVSPLEGYVTNGDDCDDSQASVSPAATEQYNEVDDNCDGRVDEEFAAYYADRDNDSYGAGEANYATTRPDGWAGNTQDCDDTRASVNPAASETYNTLDDDCDGDTDEGFTAYFADRDEDTYGAGDALYATSQPDGYADNVEDCDDTAAAVHPAAIETHNGIDDDCDGSNDEGFAAYYRDADTDGYGAGSPTYWTSGPDGYVTNNGDCDDSRASANPGASEIYNSLDDDCDGQIDEGYSPASAPTIGTASSGGKGKPVTATARWTAPASNGGSPVTAYRVQAQQVDKAGRVTSSTTWIAGPSATSLVVELKAGNYMFRVSAITAVGPGAWSANSNTVKAQ